MPSVGRGADHFVAGLLIAGLLTIPLVNLLAPLIAVAFIVHLAPRSGPVLRKP